MEPVTIYGKDTIIASGGVGSLYQYNTNLELYLQITWDMC